MSYHRMMQDQYAAERGKAGSPEEADLAFMDSGIPFGIAEKADATIATLRAEIAAKSDKILSLVGYLHQTADELRCNYPAWADKLDRLAELPPHEATIATLREELSKARKVIHYVYDLLAEAGEPTQQYDFSVRRKKGIEQARAFLARKEAK